MNYPYYIVRWSEGRLKEAAKLYRHTGIDRLFETGRIGGTRPQERTFTEEDQAVLFAQEKDRDRQARNVELLVVESPQKPRKTINDWRGRRVRPTRRK